MSNHAMLKAAEEVLSVRQKFHNALHEQDWTTAPPTEEHFVRFKEVLLQVRDKLDTVNTFSSEHSAVFWQIVLQVLRAGSGGPWDKSSDWLR